MGSEFAAVVGLGVEGDGVIDKVSDLFLGPLPRGTEWWDFRHVPYGYLTQAGGTMMLTPEQCEEMGRRHLDTPRMALAHAMNANFREKVDFVAASLRSKGVVVEEDIRGEGWSPAVIAPAFVGMWHGVERDDGEPDSVWDSPDGFHLHVISPYTRSNEMEHLGDDGFVGYMRKVAEHSHALAFGLITPCAMSTTILTKGDSGKFDEIEEESISDALTLMVWDAQGATVLNCPLSWSDEGGDVAHGPWSIASSGEMTMARLAMMSSWLGKAVNQTAPSVSKNFMRWLSENIVDPSKDARSLMLEASQIIDEALEGVDGE